MRRHERSCAPGFTLLEVLVALLVGGVLLLGARGLLTALADDEARLAVRAAAMDRERNGEAMLRALVGRLEVGTPASGPFAGAPDGARFTSWCEVPRGWLERCTVVLAFDTSAGAPALVARMGDGPALVLLRGVHDGALRYLNSAANGGQWFLEWGTGITAPVGLGVVRDRDTLIVRIGERG